VVVVAAARIPAIGAAPLIMSLPVVAKKPSVSQSAPLKALLASVAVKLG
jgi:hypothetical protein